MSAPEFVAISGADLAARFREKHAEHAERAKAHAHDLMLKEQHTKCATQYRKWAKSLDPKLTYRAHPEWAK